VRVCESVRESESVCDSVCVSVRESECKCERDMSKKVNVRV
jgi:hypothetical protein